MNGSGSEQEGDSRPPLGDVRLRIMGRAKDKTSPTTFWKRFEESPEPFRVFRSAWNELHGHSYGDLLQMHEQLEKRADKANERINSMEERLIEFEENPNVELEGKFVENLMGAREQNEFLYRAAIFFRYRAWAASALARYHEEKGVPPKWEGLRDEAKAVIQSTIDLYRLSEGAISVLEGVDDYIGDRPPEAYPDSLQELWARVAQESFPEDYDPEKDSGHKVGQRLKVDMDRKDVSWPGDVEGIVELARIAKGRVFNS